MTSIIKRDGKLVLKNNKLTGGVYINLPPSDISLSLSNILHNSPVNTNVGTLTATDYDDDYFTWSVDNTKFKLSTTTGSNTRLQRSNTGTLTGNTLENVRVTVTDNSGGSYSKSFPINIIPNEIPLDISLSGTKRIANNEFSGATLGTLTANDPDDTNWVWSIDNTKFQITTSYGPSTVLQRSSIGTLTANTLENVTVTVEDGANNQFSKSFAIDVFDGTIDQFIQAINVSNWNASSSSDMTRKIGVLFQKGDITNGSTAIVTSNSNTPITHVVVNQSYYPSDNSLMICHFVIADDDITQSNTRQYFVKRRPNSSYSTSNITLSYTDALANYAGNINLAFTNVRANAKISGLPLSDGTTSYTIPFFVGQNYVLNLVTVDLGGDGNGTIYQINSSGGGFTFNAVNGAATTYQGYNGYSNVRIDFDRTWPSGYWDIYIDWPHMSGNLTASIADSDIAARIETPQDTTLLKTFWTWSMARDVPTGTADEHLKVYWLTEVYFNTNNTVKNVYVKPVPAQDWYEATNKTRKDYSANLIRNGATLDSYGSIQHAYHTWWAAVKTEDSNASGRMHCVYGKSSTINATYNKDYMILAECFPPFSNTIVAPNGSYDMSNTYIAANNFAHRAAIDGTGNYFGRGAYPMQDLTAWNRQSHFTIKQSLINSYAGHHVYYHVRAGNSTSNIKSTGVTLKLDSNTQTNVSSTWVASGMQPAKYYNIDGRATINDGYSAAYGGTGPFYPTTGDSSHAPNWTAYNYFLHGDEDMLQAMYDHATMCSMIIVPVFNDLPWYNQSGSTAPDESWSGVAQLFDSQQRSAGWVMNILSTTAGFFPWNRKERTFLNDWTNHLGTFVERGIMFMPSNLIDLGFWQYSGTEFRLGPWQQFFVGFAACQMSTMLGIKGFTQLANLSGNLAYHLTKSDPMKAHIYYGGIFPYDTEGWNNTYNNFYSNNDFIGQWTSLTANVPANNGYFSVGFRQMWVATSNDVVYFAKNPTDANGVTYNANVLNVNIGTRYYMANASTAANDKYYFQVSATPGGTPILPNTSAVNTQLTLLSQLIPKSNLNYSYSGQDGRKWQTYDYLAIARFTLAFQYRRGHPWIDSAAFERANTMFANTDNFDDINWLVAKVKK